MAAAIVLRISTVFVPSCAAHIHVGGGNSNRYFSKDSCSKAGQNLSTISSENQQKTKVEKKVRGFLGHHVFHLRSGLSSTRKRSLNLKIQGNNFHNFVAREYTVSINN